MNSTAFFILQYFQPSLSVMSYLSFSCFYFDNSLFISSFVLSFYLLFFLFVWLSFCFPCNISFFFILFCIFSFLLPFSYACPYIKVTGSLSVCLSVCLYRRISLTSEPTWFPFTGQIHIGPGKVYNYFGGGYHHPLNRNIKKFK